MVAPYSHFPSSGPVSRNQRTTSIYYPFQTYPLRAPCWGRTCQSLKHRDRRPGHTYLEEEPDNEDLKRAHADDQAYLDKAEVDDPLLCTPDRAKVPVLARSEVFLVAGDGRELAGNLVNGLLQYRCLFRGAALLGREVDTSFILNLQRARDISSLQKLSPASAVGNLQQSRSRRIYPYTCSSRC